MMEYIIGGDENSDRSELKIIKEVREKENNNIRKYQNDYIEQKRNEKINNGMKYGNGKFIDGVKWIFVWIILIGLITALIFWSYFIYNKWMESDLCKDSISFPLYTISVIALLEIIVKYIDKFIYLNPKKRHSLIKI